MPLETHNMKPILRFFLPLALASLSLAPHRATAQPATVMADPTTGALFRPAASTFISGNSLLTTTGAAAAYQPLDSDLTAIAALTTTANGRSLLTSTTLTLAGLGITNGTTLDTIGAKTQNGTGNLVLATSPTLTTPNIGAATATSITGPTATNLTITGGSSGASLVLGSGPNAGASLAIRAGGRFNLTAAASNDAYLEYVGNAGTAGTTSVVVGQSGTNLGIIYNRSNSALTFGTNSLERTRITETGNLLIGTTTDMSGSGGLKVAGTTASTSTTTGSAIFGGGIGVAGAINAGGTGNFVGDAIVTSTAQSVFRATATNNNGIAGTVHTTGNGGSLQSWLVGSNVSGASGEFVIRDSTGTSNALTITKGALAATFGGVTVLKNYTVAKLPDAASYTYGEAYVSDATQAAGTSIGSAPTGGGSVVRGVYSNGSAWLLR